MNRILNCGQTMGRINRSTIFCQRFLSLQVAFCLLGAGAFMDRSFGQAGEAKKVTAIEQVSAELDLKKSAFQTRREKLFRQYAVAVENLGKGFQQSGDLDGAIKAKKEAKIAREENAVGNVQFGGIDKLRKTLRRELEAINGEEQKVLIVHREHLIQVLTTRKVNFTKAGKLEEALDADKALRQLEIEQKEARRGLTGGEGGKPGMPDEREGKQPAELGDVTVVMGRDADPFLKRFNPRKSLVRRAELKASSFHPHRKPENVVSPQRPDKLEDIERDEWAMTQGTGWLQADWKEAVPVKTIL